MLNKLVSAVTIFISKLNLIAKKDCQLKPPFNPFTLREITCLLRNRS